MHRVSNFFFRENFEKFYLTYTVDRSDMFILYGNLPQKPYVNVISFEFPFVYEIKALKTRQNVLILYSSSWVSTT